MGDDESFRTLVTLAGWGDGKEGGKETATERTRERDGESIRVMNDLSGGCQPRLPRGRRGGARAGRRDRAFPFESVPKCARPRETMNDREIWCKQRPSAALTL